MAKTLAGVLTVLMAALLFAGCVTVEAPKAEPTTTTTISKDQICADLREKVEDAIQRGTVAATDKFLATTTGKSQLEINRLQSNYESALMEAKQFREEFDTKGCVASP
jgi:PBP1b-binding outer membrane lipoprotein LpoB